MSIFNNSRNLLLISLIYLLSNFLIFFVYSIFWDDWYVIGNPEGWAQQCIGTGDVLQGEFITFLEKLTDKPILFFRTCIFFVGYINVLIFFQILNKLKFDEVSILIISSLFAAFPLGYGHMTIICFPYQIGLLFQLMSILTYLIYLNKRIFLFGIINCVFQFLAVFFLHSTIVFWFGILLVFALIKGFPDGKFNKISFRLFLKEMTCSLMFFLPCVVFWVIRSIYWMPTGVFAESSYQSFTLQNLLLAPMVLLQSIFVTQEFIFSQPYYLSFSRMLIMLWLLGALILYRLMFSSIIKNDSKGNANFFNFLICIILFVSGIMAYILIGYVQNYNTCNDRHGILLPVSICPLIFYISLYLAKRIKTVILVNSIIISMFVTFSIYEYSTAIERSFKDDAIIRFFQNTDLKEGNIQIVDSDNNGMSRFWTWSGVYRKATGRQDRCFAVNTEDIYANDFYLRECVNQKDADNTPPKQTIVIREKDKINARTILLYYYLKSCEEYNSLVSDAFEFVVL